MSMLASRASRLTLSLSLLASLSAATQPTVESEVATARRLAGKDFASSLYLCEGTATRGADALAAGPQWLPPVKAFDNLWYIGTTFVGVWVLDTGKGLILFDATGSESDMRDRFIPALRSIGRNPKDIRYALITHGHWDHYGGAKYLQENYGTKIGLTAEDWDLLAREKPGSLARAPYFGEDQADRPPPRRDFVITDGQKLKLGDTELTLFVSPGHTPGTLSALIPVRKGKRRYVLSLLGGTAFPRKLEPDSQMGGLVAFEKSVNRLAAQSKTAGAVGLINTHVHVDGTMQRLELARARKPSAPNSFVLGADKVERYYGMFAACLRASMLRPRDPNAGPPMPSKPAKGS
jgi:metallo-beta-lactamase class B